MTNIRKPVAILALAALGLAGTAIAGHHGDGDHRGGGRGGPPASVERAAMHNLLAERLAGSTGRDAAGIASLLGETPPWQVADKLGLSPEQMHEAVQSARATLIERAAAAGLITAAQAKELAAARPPAPPEGGPKAR